MGEEQIMDVGSLLNEMRAREESGSRSILLLTLEQGRCAARVKKMLPQEWKSALFENVGLKKSTWYDRLSIWSEFGPLMITVEYNVTQFVEPDYSTISPASLKLLLKVCKGTNDEVKHAYLEQAAALSYSDLKKLVEEKLGKEVCDCVRFKTETIEVCADCGKKRKKEDD